MLRFTVLVASLAAFGTAPLAAESSLGREPVEATIHYGALDLTGVAGQQAFDRLIKRTVRRMCSEPGVMTLTSYLNARRCRGEAMANARPQRDFAIATAMRRERLASASFALVAFR